MPTLYAVSLQRALLPRGTLTIVRAARLLALTSDFDIIKVCDYEQGTWMDQDSLFLSARQKY